MIHNQTVRACWQMEHPVRYITESCSEREILIITSVWKPETKSHKDKRKARHYNHTMVFKTVLSALLCSCYRAQQHPSTFSAELVLEIFISFISPIGI